MLPVQVVSILTELVSKAENIHFPVKQSYCNIIFCCGLIQWNLGHATGPLVWGISSLHGPYQCNLHLSTCLSSNTINIYKECGHTARSFRDFRTSMYVAVYRQQTGFWPEGSKQESNSVGSLQHVRTIQELVISFPQDEPCSDMWNVGSFQLINVERAVKK
jgi:hypothetical protein